MMYNMKKYFLQIINSKIVQMLKNNLIGDLNGLCCFLPCLLALWTMVRIPVNNHLIEFSSCFSVVSRDTNNWPSLSCDRLSTTCNTSWVPGKISQWSTMVTYSPLFELSYCFRFLRFRSATSCLIMFVNITWKCVVFLKRHRLTRCVYICRVINRLTVLVKGSGHYW